MSSVAGAKYVLSCGESIRCIPVDYNRCFAAVIQAGSTTTLVHDPPSACSTFGLTSPIIDSIERIAALWGVLPTFLLHAGVLREPLLHLSLHFKQHRSTYYDLLDRVRHERDWESWLVFFLEGVRETADGAVATARRLARMFADDRHQIEPAGRRAGSALCVHEALEAHPLLSLPAICDRTGLSFPAASSAIELLLERGIARELTGRRRNRLFLYDRYLAILNEGTEPL